MLFSTPSLGSREEDAIARVDQLRQALRHAVSEPRRWTGLLRRVLFARHIQGSNSIEGYNVTLDEAVGAAEGDEALDVESETWLAVTGYRNAMTYVLQLADDLHFSYGEGLLRSLHFMMLGHDLSKSPGKWRAGPVYVRNEATGEMVYEGPDAELVPSLMRELVAWLGEGDLGLPAVVRAAMSHLNLTMIHPFRDGNGRMARALQTLVLAREGILAPEFCSIEEYLGRNTHAYYDVLAEVGTGGWYPEGDARPWVRFAIQAHFRQARTLLRRVKETEDMWNLLEEEIAREGLPQRVMPALYYATSRLRVRNALYRSAADVSENVASRDLALLVEKGFLIARGEKRGRFYVGSPRLDAAREKVRRARRMDERDDLFPPDTA